MSTPVVPIPGYTAGTWQIDPAHSSATFSVRHLVSKVRGGFSGIAGEIHAAADPLASSVTISIDPTTIDTKNAQRDEHLRSADFLEVQKYPEISFASTGIRTSGADFLIDGDLTIKGVTRPVTAELEVGGFTPGPDGALRAGFTARLEINRMDFNVSFHAVLETGGVMVGERITIELEVEAIHQAEQA